MGHWTIAEVASALRTLGEISGVSLIGSRTTGKKAPKDIDLLLTLNISGARLEKLKRRLKGGITRVLRKASTPSLYDIFLITTDGSEWRLRPWEDTETGKLTWEWE